MSKKLILILNQLSILLITIFSISSFLALLNINKLANYFLNYNSSYNLIQTNWQLYFAKLAASWLYWLGGGAYVVTLILTIYCLLKLLKSNFKLSLDRLFGALSLFLVV